MVAIGNILSPPFERKEEQIRETAHRADGLC
jgi:hypothetical protein